MVLPTKSWDGRESHPNRILQGADCFCCVYRCSGDSCAEFCLSPKSRKNFTRPNFKYSRVFNSVFLDYAGKTCFFVCPENRVCKVKNSSLLCLVSIKNFSACYVREKVDFWIVELNVCKEPCRNSAAAHWL